MLQIHVRQSNTYGSKWWEVLLWFQICYDQVFIYAVNFFYCKYSVAKKKLTHKEKWCMKLGIESHFVGVQGPYELHRKEKQIKCTALAVHENLLFFPMQFIWPVNTDKMRFNTYIYIF